MVKIRLIETIKVGNENLFQTEDGIFSIENPANEDIPFTEYCLSKGFNSDQNFEERFGSKNNREKYIC